MQVSNLLLYFRAYKRMGSYYVNFRCNGDKKCENFRIKAHELHVVKKDKVLHAS